MASSGEGATCPGLLKWTSDSLTPAAHASITSFARATIHHLQAMNQTNTSLLTTALDSYFANFESTRELASELILERKHPVEALILLCARLDALASDAASEETSRKKAFSNFVARYGGQKGLLSVSLGDLYYELGYHKWALAGTIPLAGRLHRFSHVDDPFIHFLEDAGLPLTLKESEALLDIVMRILKKEFRVTPGQRLSKRRLVKSAELQALIKDRVGHTRLRRIAENLPNALRQFLESKKVSTILYERFRSEAIHGASIRIDRSRFFEEPSLYWKPIESEYYGRFELIEFSCRFLLSLLDNCIRNYRAALIAKGKLPPDVFFQAFGDEMFSHLQLLDEALLPSSGPVRLKAR